MPRTWSVTIHHKGKPLTAKLLLSIRKDGTHFEVNLPGFPRFSMKYTELGRYDAVRAGHLDLPDELLLTLSDAIERLNA